MTASPPGASLKLLVSLQVQWFSGRRRIAKGTRRGFLSGSIRTKLVPLKNGPRRHAIMMRIGKLTDYATVILAILANDRSRLLNAGTLAERTHIAAPTVAKLLKQLH